MLISKIRTSLSCRTVEGEGALEATGSSGRKIFREGLKAFFSDDNPCHGQIAGTHPAC